MGLLSWLWPRKSAQSPPPPTDDFWYGQVGRATASGQYVSADTAMRVAAVYACVSLIAQTLATVPLIVYRRLDRGKDRAPNHPLYSLLHRKPNAWQTSFEWREMMQGHVLLRGNGYSRIVPGPRGPVDQLIPLHPDRVRPEQLDGGRILYRYQPKNGPEELINQDFVFHIKGLSSDGVVGLSPIDLHGETIGAAMATREYGARFFQNDARPGGVLTHPKVLKDTALEHLKESMAKFSGPQRHGTLILEEGMDWKSVGINNEQAQFLESQKYNTADIARLFRVPPHMIGDLEKATFSNIEHQAIEFVVHTMTQWFTRWEQRIAADLILAPDVYFVEFLLDGLLRGDIKSRYDAYAVGRQWGWLSANDVREKENMNPRADRGGDAYLEPLNMNPSNRPQASGLVDHRGRPLATIEESAREPKAGTAEIAVDLTTEQPGRYTNGATVH